MSGLTPAGFIATRQSEFLDLIRDNFDARLVALGFQATPDYDRDVLVGNLTEIVSFFLGQGSEVDQALYDAWSVGNATGLQLDNLVLIVGVKRDEATKGTVTLTCTGTDGTEINQGKIVQGGGTAGTARWVISGDVVIGAVTPGEVEVVAIAEESGPIVALTGEIGTIVTLVDGWTSVTNPADANPGRAREEDDELKAKRQRALASAGAGSTNAIRAALLNLDFIIGAAVLDNKLPIEVIKEGITIAPHGIAAVVAPASMTTEQQQQVVDAIYFKLCGGTETSGDQSATVTKDDGRSEIIRFSFSADTPVNLAWTLQMEAGFVPADVKEALKELTADFFLTLGPGSTVFPLPLCALAFTVDGIADVTELLLNGVEDPATHTVLELPVLGTFVVA